MTFKSNGVIFGLVLAAPFLWAQTSDAPAQTPQASPAAKPTPRHKAHKAPPLELPPLPNGPLRQLPMDQIPAIPAKVTYLRGMLTISAQNSTLGEILRDVRALTGAAIDLPPGSTGENERVVTHLGPGPTRDVLVGLLNGTSFNYVMVGSSSDPTAIASVILTPKEAVAGQTGQTQTVANVQNNYPATVPPRPFNPQAIAPVPGNGVPAPGAEAEETPTDEQTAEESADEEAQPTQPGQPSQPGVNGQVADQQQDPNQPNGGPKTPEQILEMLRRQQPGGQPPNPQQPQPQPQE